MIAHYARSALDAVRTLPGRVLRRRGSGEGQGFSRPVAQVWVVLEKVSPTLDYLVLPAVRALGVPVEQRFLHQMPRDGELPAGTLVVLVRYVNDRWRVFLDRHRAELAGLVYFMDDDLLAGDTHAALPAAYKKKLTLLVGRHRQWIRQTCSAYWVSTDALAAKYASLDPTVVPWAPDAALLTQTEPVTVCYHGSASHVDEQRWLKPIVANVMAACPQVHFEIFGDLAVNRLYRDLPRTTVLHPMSWENYLAYAGSVRRHIGLSPLLPGEFNASRGPTKFYDLARMGAVGIYSDTVPYRGFIEDGRDGILLKNDVAVWTDALIELVSDTARIRTLASAARTRAITPHSHTSERLS